MIAERAQRTLQQNNPIYSRGHALLLDKRLHLLVERWRAQPLANNGERVRHGVHVRLV